MAAISDKITKTMSNQNPATTTVAAQRAVGATELRGVNLDGWQDETATHFITYKVDAQGDLVDGSQIDWKGVVNRQSNSIVNLKRTGGAADQGNAIGDVIEPAPTAAYGNELAEALLRHHDTEGRLKPNTVTYDHIDETTEYKFIASPNDLNDAQFLVPGKWRFGNNQQVRNTKNLPSPGETGILQTITHSSGIPGRNPWSYSIQIFTLLNTRMFMRTASTGDSATDIKYRQWQEFAVIKKPDSPQESGWNVYINPVNGKKRYWREGNTQGGRLDNGAFTYVETGIKFPANTRVINATALATDQSISATPRAAVENISFCVQSHYQNANAHVYWYYELEEK